jgi:hypothetical protein
MWPWQKSSSEQFSSSFSAPASSPRVNDARTPATVGENLIRTSFTTSVSHRNPGSLSLRLGYRPGYRGYLRSDEDGRRLMMRRTIADDSAAESSRRRSQLLATGATCPCGPRTADRQSGLLRRARPRLRGPSETSDDSPTTRMGPEVALKRMRLRCGMFLAPRQSPFLRAGIVMTVKGSTKRPPGRLVLLEPPGDRRVSPGSG